MAVGSLSERVQVPPRAAARACWIYVAACACLIGIYFVNPHIPGVAGWQLRYPLYVGLNASGAGGMIYGIRRWRPSSPAPWWLMACGQLSYTVGDILFYWARYVDHTSVFPSISDAFYLARVPLVAVALALIIRRRCGHNLTALLDSLCVGVATTAVAWVFLLDPYTHATLGEAVRVVSLAYPVTDLVLVAMAVRLMNGGGRKSASFRFLTLGLILLAATDSLFGWLNLHGITYGPGSLVELGWLSYYVTVGACGIHPSMRDLTRPVRINRFQFSQYRLATLSVAGLAGPVLLAAESLADRSRNDFPIMIATIAILLMISVRLASVMQREQRADEVIRHQAFHDSLTGLSNRARFYDHLELAVERSRREGDTIAVLLIDLDGFKDVNDSLGHAAGDSLLIEVAERLVSCTRTPDTVARLGGDEFVILAHHVKGVGDAEVLARRILERFDVPAEIQGTQVSITGSIGVACASAGAVEPDQLVRFADAAMYAAKRDRSGSFRVFDPVAGYLASIDPDEELRAAIEDGEFCVYYQPIAALSSGVVTGVEALVRWQHPTRGTVAPSEFIPRAESSGLIVKLGAFVLESACRQVAAWRTEFGGDLVVNVNVSACELVDEGFIGRVGSIIEATGIDPRSLTLELTESTLLSDPRIAASRLLALREMGVGLALDDFGTEFSSLAHLRWLPVDSLKVDKSFIDSIATEREGFMFVQALVQLAHALGLDAVAEGVENSEQLVLLRQMGCDFVQGYLIARPMPASAFERQVDAMATRTTPGRTRAPAACQLALFDDQPEALVPAPASATAISSIYAAHCTKSATSR